MLTSRIGASIPLWDPSPPSDERSAILRPTFSFPEKRVPTLSTSRLSRPPSPEEPLKSRLRGFSHTHCPASSRTASFGTASSQTSSFAPSEPRSPAAAGVLCLKRLPRDMTERDLLLMFTFANDFVKAELHAQPPAHDGLPVSVSALAKFRTLAAAATAQAVLQQKPELFGSSGCEVHCEIHREFSHDEWRPNTQRSRFFESEEPPCSSSQCPILPRSLLQETEFGQPNCFAGLNLERRPMRPTPEQSSPVHSQTPVQRSQPHSASHGSPSFAEPSYVYRPTGPRVMPPANPADQNPPCNTLYVGNLPPDTLEEELKQLFSCRPGYKKMCFRTKANGPMCFVEFEDENYAGRALDELYGVGLSNSVKGGIRLSYSKNPLGVRSVKPQKSHFHAA